MLAEFQRKQGTLLSRLLRKLWLYALSGLRRVLSLDGAPATVACIGAERGSLLLSPSPGKTRG